MKNVKTKEGLQRIIGAKDLAITIINGTIGAGIFVLPAIISQELGAYGIFSYIFCGLLLAAIMLCYVEIGSKVTSSGGSYAYVEAAFGGLAGFIINWLFFFGWGVLGSAAVANIIADSIAVLLPVFSRPMMRILLLFILFTFMVGLNVRGTKSSVGFIKTITLIKILPLIMIIVVGFSQVKISNLELAQFPSLNSFGNIGLITFFAFAGFETSLNVSGELKDPARTIPKGIFLGGIAVLLIYLLLQTVAQGVLGNSMATFREAPLAAVAEKSVGPVGGTILLIAAAVSCFGITTGDIFNTPRVLFAGAKDGLFPRFLSLVHPRYATPYWAIIIYGALIFLFSVSGGFTQLAVLASAAILIIYLAVIMATLKLRKSRQVEGSKEFRIPGGWLIPAIGIIAIIWLLTQLSKWEIVSVLLFIIILAVAYLLMQLLKKKVNSLPATIHSQNKLLSMNVILQSVITCPACGQTQEETMPTDSCVFFYECLHCKTRLKPKEGDCCVFCSYGSEKCPSIQAGSSCK